MLDFIQVLESTPAWTIVTVGIILVIIDVLITSDSYLAWIGFAVIGVAGLNALDAPGSVQLGAFPVLTVISLAVVRRFFIKTSILQDQSANVENIIGASGTVLDVFKTASGSGNARINGHGEWRIRTSEGKEIKPLDKVRVVGRDGLTLIVSLETESNIEISK